MTSRRWPIDLQQAASRYFPGEGENLGALALSVPNLAKAAAPLAYPRHGQGLDVVDSGVAEDPPAPGRRMRGIPRWPSMEAIRAVSPQTGRAPSLRQAVKENRAENILTEQALPRLLYGAADAVTASGYSAARRKPFGGFTAKAESIRPSSTAWGCSRTPGP